MTVKYINPRYYVIRHHNHDIPVRIKRNGKQLMERWLDLDFRGIAG